MMSIRRPWPILHRLVGAQQEVVRRRVVRERLAHGVEAFLDALRDRDLAFAREQLDRAHLAHVHAHRVGRAAELRVDRRRERGRGFLGGFVVGDHRLAHQQRLGIRCLLVHRDAHVVDHLHDVFDLLRIDDLARQVIVDLGVGQEALFLAARDQQLQLRLAILGRGRRQPDLELLGAGTGACLAGLARRLRGGGLGIDRLGGRAALTAGARTWPLAALIWRAWRRRRPGAAGRATTLSGGALTGCATLGMVLVGRTRLRVARGRLRLTA